MEADIFLSILIFIIIFSMKNLLTIILIIIFLPSFSQSKLDTRPLLYRTFISGKVAMKSGAFEAGEFNYNTNNQSIVFFNGKEILELTGQENIKEVILDKLIFIPISGKFYEKTSNHSLLISYSNKRKAKTNTVEKEGLTNVDGAANSNNISNTMLLRKYNNLTGLSYIRSFWWLENGELKSVNSIKEIAKAVGSTKDEVASFAKKNDIDIKELKGVEKLISHNWEH